jgi:hypothetical protein
MQRESKKENLITKLQRGDWGEVDKKLIMRELNQCLAIEILGHVYLFKNESRGVTLPVTFRARCGVGYSLVQSGTWPMPLKIGLVI